MTIVIYRKTSVVTSFPFKFIMEKYFPKPHNQRSSVGIDIINHLQLLVILLIWGLARVLLADLRSYLIIILKLGGIPVF